MHGALHICNSVIGAYLNNFITNKVSSCILFITSLLSVLFGCLTCKRITGEYLKAI